jgi:hypothetical protein
MGAATLVAAEATTPVGAAMTVAAEAALVDSAAAVVMSAAKILLLRLPGGRPRCNNPNFWEIKINGFIKIPDFGDNKNLYFKYKINFLSFKTCEFEHLLPGFK